MEWNSIGKGRSWSGSPFIRGLKTPVQTRNELRGDVCSSCAFLSSKKMIIFLASRPLKTSILVQRKSRGWTRIRMGKRERVWLQIVWTSPRAILWSVDHLEATIKVCNAHDRTNNSCSSEHQGDKSKKKHHVFPYSRVLKKNYDSADEICKYAQVAGLS